MNQSPLNPEPRRGWLSQWPLLALVLFGFAYCWWYLDLSSRWWFEDDPFLFSYAAKLQDPAAAFYDPVVLKQFGAGGALVPMQVISYWSDMKAFPRSPHFAYFHQVVAFLLLLIAIYFLLLELLADRAASAIIAALWAVTPAVAVVTQFLSTRHYLEGLLFACVSALPLLRSRWRGGTMKAGLWLLSLSCGIIALLYKEVFLAIVPTLYLAHAWYFRRLPGLAAAVGLCAGYALYRAWIFGWGLHYSDVPFLSPWEYARFLSKLPYTFSANYGGYVLLACTTVVYARCLRRGIASYSAAAFAVALLLLSLIVVIPVSAPLYGTIRRPDPWYRIVFVLHTIGILATGCGVRVGEQRRAQLFFLCLAAAVLIPGVHKTRSLWQDLTASAEREGTFYLANPDKILLSEQEAWWFIPGVQDMYGGAPHFVLLRDLRRPGAEPHTTVWSFRTGRFVELAPADVNDIPR